MITIDSGALVLIALIFAVALVVSVYFVTRGDDE